MKKVLFLIHDLSGGGAEKVLTNLVNNMDPNRFDVTVQVLFGGGTNEQLLKEHVKLKRVFPKMIPGNSHWMKLLSPAALHWLFVREHYDIEVSYLEGPSARVVSGCRDPETKLVCWIHVEQKTAQKACRSFRSQKEAVACYNRFDRLIGVSETVKQDFCSILPITADMDVLYNTIESGTILEKAAEPVEFRDLPPRTIKLVSVGTLKPVKGLDRLIRIVGKVSDMGYPVHLFLLGRGPDETKLRTLAQECGVADKVSFLGYQSNPYKYVANCDLYICASHAEGFSTAATEALIVGTPVCTTEVSGMREMLGDSEYGLITENSEKALLQGVMKLLRDPELLSYYKEQAKARGLAFSTERTVKAVEDMLDGL